MFILDFHFRDEKYPDPGPRKRLQPSREHAAFQHISLPYFLLWELFGLPVPGFTDPNELGSNPDLDPNLHHWKQKIFLFV
jgi:hypothetical protein